MAIPLPLYAFGTQKIENFLLAALEGCEDNVNVVLYSHPTLQKNILSTRKEAHYLILDVDDEILKMAKNEYKYVVKDIYEVLNSYTGKSPMIPDLIKFVLSHKRDMKRWYTKTYGSPSSLRTFAELIKRILYEGADMDILLHFIPTHGSPFIGSDWFDRVNEDGLIIIDEISPNKVDFDKIVSKLSFNDDTRRGVVLYKNGSEAYRYEEDNRR